MLSIRDTLEVIWQFENGPIFRKLSYNQLPVNRLSMTQEIKKDLKHSLQKKLLEGTKDESYKEQNDGRGLFQHEMLAYVEGLINCLESDSQLANKLMITKLHELITKIKINSNKI